MKNYIKSFLLVVVVLFFWNISVKDGHAANQTLSTAQAIEDHEYFNFDLNKNDVLENGNYGKYYKIVIPTKGLIKIRLDEGKVSLLSEDGKTIVKKNINSDDFESLIEYVEAGTYYLLIEGKSIEKLDGKGLFKKVVDETEPNDAMKNATNITKYVVYKNKEDRYSRPYIQGSNDNKSGTDIDYYKFTVENQFSDVILMINFGFFDNKDADFSLINAKGKEIDFKGLGMGTDEGGFMEAYIPAGTYYLKFKSPKGTYGKSYYFDLDIKKAIPGVKTSDVMVKNTTKKDTITLKNLVVGWEYTISSENFEKTFKAKKTTQTFETNSLAKQGGALWIYVKNPKDETYGETIIVKYAAEPTASIKASNIAVKNNFNKEKDSITIKNLVKGNTYTIYKDAKKKTKLTSFKADGKSKSKTIKLKKQLGAKKGSVYVTVKKPKYSESATTKVTYKAEKLPTLKAKNVTIKNNTGKDKITLKGLTVGSTYTIYKDSKKTKKLTSFTAKGKTKTLTVKQVGKKAGKVYIVASKKGYQSSSTTKVSFKAQSK